MEAYGLLASGYGEWPIIKQIAWLLGQVMIWIYNVLSAIVIENIGICIIIFTVIVYTLMIPLTIKQQKFSKMQAVMQPEIQKIQKKYEGKKDQASMLKQQDEMKMIYEKYGTSMSSGCLPLLIQMPILFALYPVIQNIPNYVTGVRDVYMPVVEKIMSVSGWQSIMEELGSASPVLMNPNNYDYTQANTIVNVLYKFQDATWGQLLEKMPDISDIAHTTMDQVTHLNSFIGINIGEAPINMLTAAFTDFSIIGIILAVIIPVMAGLTQFISVKLTSAQTSVSTSSSMNQDNPMMSSMKTMTYVMPLFSVWIGFTLPAGMGLYWAISAVVRCVQQIAVNKYLSKKSVDDIIKQNQEKAKKKREKKGTSAQEINRMATISTRNVENKSVSKAGITEREKEEKIQKAQQYAQNAKPGSLTAKANLVSRYNSGQKTELPTEENAPDQTEDTVLGKRKNKKKK